VDKLRQEWKPRQECNKTRGTFRIGKLDGPPQGRGRNSFVKVGFIIAAVVNEEGHLSILLQVGVLSGCAGCGEKEVFRPRGREGDEIAVGCAVGAYGRQDGKLLCQKQFCQNDPNFL
jgi:hypothetical protein